MGDLEWYDLWWSMLRGDIVQNDTHDSWWSWWFVRIILWKIMPTLKSPPGRTWCFQTNLAPFLQEGFNQRLAEGNHLPGYYANSEQWKRSWLRIWPKLITMNLLKPFGWKTDLWLWPGSPLSMWLKMLRGDSTVNPMTPQVFSRLQASPLKNSKTSVLVHTQQNLGWIFFTKSWYVF